MTNTLDRRQWPMVTTVALGSFLLFMVEPMVARIALPRLGGSPAVWSSAVLVYQTLLLTGYAWAHVTGALPPRRQAVVHLALLLAAVLWLPIGLATRILPEGADPAIWTPLLIGGSIGPPFIAIAAQSTILQRWRATRGGNPYPLYAASNAGSLAGLLLYPFTIEPLIGLASQRATWTIGYAALVVMTALCATTLPRIDGTPAVERSAPPSAARHIRWMALAAIPSGLMLSTTTIITTDLAGGPLLWVLPLAVYLASFIAAFSGRERLITSASRVAPLLILVSAGLSTVPQGGIPTISITLGLATLYAASVAIHGRLYLDRPDDDRLSGFYLSLAAGGVAGGVFSGILAPIAFDWTWEHPALLVAATVSFPSAPLLGVGSAPGRTATTIAVTAALLAIAAWTAGGATAMAATIAIMALGIASVNLVGRRTATVACLVSLLAVQAGWGLLAGAKVRLRERSYFGITRVVDVGNDRIMLHGTTTHGVERARPSPSTTPIGYYSATSGVARALAAAPGLYGTGARIDVVGLGTGTLACWARPGQAWTFHEIDPGIVRIARDSGLFHYLGRCLPGVPIVTGDARLTLSRRKDSSVDMLVLDAFSSDSIPVHVMTREAFAAYDRITGPRGVVVAHISNRHLDLEPVLAAMDGRHAMLLDDMRPGDAEIQRSVWVATSRDPSVIAAIRATDTRWRPLRRIPGFKGWSDDHASIAPLIRW